MRGPGDDDKAMKVHEPNLDMLSAYVDGALSPDAMRSMEQHLRRCDDCSRALEAERGFLRSLDSMAEVRPPEDFVNRVMGRVAQYPAHRPGTSLPWREAMRWSVAASAVVAVALVAALAWLVGSGALADTSPASWFVYGIGGLADVGTTLVAGARDLVGPVLVILEQIGQMIRRLLSLAIGSGWVVQLTLLLLTVSLNYAFTRMVLDYQRRH